MYSKSVSLEVHTSVCSLNRSEFNQDFSREEEKNIFHQLWMQVSFLLNLDFPNSDSIRQTYEGWRGVDMQDLEELL